MPLSYRWYDVDAKFTPYDLALEQGYAPGTALTDLASA
jgi:hypothetical protein